ncbi:MAG: elongation factor P [Acidobacteriota bacterium]|nr:MAG: elongation factor P [Acidobacteriota bacterium]
MPSTADFKKHLRLLIDGDPYAIVEHTLQSPSARGSATLVRTRLRHLLTGQLIEKTFKAGESFDSPDLSYRPAQFLYSDGDALHFMDEQSYEQFSLAAEGLPDVVPWLVEGLTVRAVHFRGAVATVELPSTMEVEITETEPAVRGNTVSGKVTKRAIVANGAEIQVPLYLEAAERIEVDPREGRFIRRSSN